MARKISWGVLGAAKIGVEKVIPAIQRGEASRVDAIASRDIAKARRAAADLGIAKAYGSYEEAHRRSAIEAVYNPLPNDLHVPWTIRALEAGKHVLCEKPVALDAAGGGRADRGAPALRQAGRRGLHGAFSPAMAARARNRPFARDRRRACDPDVLFVSDDGG